MSDHTPLAETADFVVMGGVPYPLALRDYLALFGAAVVAWNHIEDQLWDICGCAVGARHVDAFASVFARVSGVDSRVKATGAAIAYGIRSESVHAQWKGLERALGALRPDRNAIVHGVLLQSGKGGPWLAPPLADPQKRKVLLQSDGFGVPPEKVEAFLVACDELGRGLRHFLVELVLARNAESVVDDAAEAARVAAWAASQHGAPSE